MHFGIKFKPPILLNESKAYKGKVFFSEPECQELNHAFSYLMALRLENQAEVIMAKSSQPLNWIKIDRLTKVQTVTLIEIFKVIRDFQARMRISFTKTL